MLEEMGHPQTSNPIQKDNSTAYGIVNTKVNQKSSKAMDMRFYWIKDKIEQDKYLIYWEPGGDDLTDYFTNRHSSAHHNIMRIQYVHNTHEPMIYYNTAAKLNHTARVC
jgi:hypothetical protein